MQDMRTLVLFVYLMVVLYTKSTRQNLGYLNATFAVITYTEML